MLAIEVENYRNGSEICSLSDVVFGQEGETFRFRAHGAGKTTTIRILTGISKPTVGRARIFGLDIVKETIAA